jgi:hypothetical protein
MHQREVVLTIIGWKSSILYCFVYLNKQFSYNSNFFFLVFVILLSKCRVILIVVVVQHFFVFYFVAVLFGLG